MADGRSVRIGNCSGFYGDRLSAMREQLEGGELDYVTGDYLAELTMLILGRDTFKDPTAGYAKTFLTQLGDCLTLALEKGVRIVSNAGGLNPRGLAERIEALGTGAKVAYVDGDDLRGKLPDFPHALTANAYLGAFGIARALQEGADVVVTGRVTDASVVVGPAIAHYGWTPQDLDALAGAVVAGHVIECGTQATGGNFSGFQEVFGLQRGLDTPPPSGSGYSTSDSDAGRVASASEGSPTGEGRPSNEGRTAGHLVGRVASASERIETTTLKPLGFPIAEVAADGTSVITKHPGTGGAVTVDTVTAQLLYEIQGPRYLGPDVTTDLTSIRLEQLDTDRVAIGGVRGEAPPEQLKVAVNELGGYRNRAEFVLTGLDLAAKEQLLRVQLAPTLEHLDHRWSAEFGPTDGARSESEASKLLRLEVYAADADAVGRAFTGPVIELALASYPGFHVTRPPERGTPYGIYRPAYVERELAREVVHLLWTGDSSVVEALAGGLDTSSPSGSDYSTSEGHTREGRTGEGRTGEGRTGEGRGDGSFELRPLGEIAFARSGDKGGDANIGLWIPQGRPEAAVAWLLETVTEGWLRELIPGSEELALDITPLPNLRGVNVVLHGWLDLGVAQTSRFDPQAKALGEWVRSRKVPIPKELLDE